MSPETRALLKRAVDRAVRAGIPSPPAITFATGVCSSCGIGWDDRTVGCQRCSERHQRRAWYSVPANREHCRRRQNEMRRANREHYRRLEQERKRRARRTPEIIGDARGREDKPYRVSVK